MPNSHRFTCFTIGFTIVKNRDKKDQQIWSHKSQEQNMSLFKSLNVRDLWNLCRISALWCLLTGSLSPRQRPQTLPHMRRPSPLDSTSHVPHNQAKEAAMSLAFANERCFNESFTSMSLGWSKLGKRHLNRQRIQLAACRLVVFCHRDFFDWFVMICVFPLQKITVRKRVTTTPGHPWV